MSSADIPSTSDTVSGAPAWRTRSPERLVNLAFRQSFLTLKNGDGAYVAFIAFYVMCCLVPWAVLQAAASGAAARHVTGVRSMRRGAWTRRSGVSHPRS